MSNITSITSGFQKVYLIGTSTIAVHCTKKIKDIGLPIIAIEYQHAEISPLSQLCERENIPFFRLNKAEITNILLSVNEKCLVVSAFCSYIFPSTVVKRENLIIINYHNALLPKFTGRNAEAWVIFMQEKETGITWHYVNDSIDGGDIICQKSTKLQENITSLGLLKEQHILAASSFDEILPRVFNGEKGLPQVLIDPNNMHYSRDIPNNGYLDLTWNSNKIYAFLRAMDYGPLYTLGRPKLQYNDKCYTWKKYEYKSIETICREKSVTISDDFIKIICEDAEIFLYRPQQIQETKDGER